MRTPRVLLLTVLAPGAAWAHENRGRELIKASRESIAGAPAPVVRP